MKNIICLVGESGAGKGTAADILKEYGYIAYVLGNEVRAHAQQAGLSNPSRAELQEFANIARREFGADYYVSRVIRIIESQSATQIIIDGVRNMAELAKIRGLQNEDVSVSVIGIVADPEVRFSRILERRNSSDPMIYVEFLENDQRERGMVGDQFSQQNEACLREADILIRNDTTFTEFRSNLASKLRLSRNSNLEGIHYFPNKERF